MISNTDDRTKANILERKRIAIVHAKFVLTENRHYFAHFPHNGFRDALLACNYCAYSDTAINARCSEYNGVILTRHYCAYNDMAFVSRNTRYDAGDFAYRYCGFGDADFTARYIAYFGVTFCVGNMCFRTGDFMARYSRYKAGSFYPLL